MKTYKQQLIEHLRTKITERVKMKSFLQYLKEAVTPAGIKQQEQIQGTAKKYTEEIEWDHREPGWRGSRLGPQNIQWIEELHRKYHEGLRWHPTNLYDATGRHLGDARRLFGHPDQDPIATSPEMIAKNEQRIRDDAHRLNFMINRHNSEMDKYYGKKGVRFYIPDEHRPDPAHLNNPSFEDAQGPYRFAFTARDHRDIPRDNPLI